MLTVLRGLTVANFDWSDKITGKIIMLEKKHPIIQRHAISDLLVNFLLFSFLF